MKKVLALLIGLTAVLSMTLTSCGKAATTERYARWKEGESYEFAISMADFAPEGAALFNSYSRKVKQKDSEGKEKESIVTCYKDNVITNAEQSVLTGGDQLRPKSVKGKYTLKIENDTSSTRKLVTSQVMYSQYETSKLNELNCLDKLKDYVATQEENPFTDNNGLTTLRSETRTEVVFTNNASQQPKSSVMENKGFYIGKLFQGPSDYKYETTYDLANAKVSVKKDNGEAEERKLELAKGAECIDAAQMILYARSLDKSSSAFADTPSVSVYDVTTNKVSSARFGLTRQNYTLLNNNGKEVVASLDAVSMTVGGIPFMAMYSLPDLTSFNGGSYDYLSDMGDKRCKYTTVKFRSGWYSYEMLYAGDYAEVVNKINVGIAAA